jgi:hypothetical protein
VNENTTLQEAENADKPERKQRLKKIKDTNGE